MWVGLSCGKSIPRIRGMRGGSLLTLALFVARVGADHVHPTLPLDELAILADALDAGTHFHGLPLILQTAPAGTREKTFYSARQIPARAGQLGWICKKKENG